MTDKKQALTDLLAKVEAGNAKSWMYFTRAFGLGLNNRHIRAASAYNGSLDDAKALHEAVLPGWTASVGQNAHHGDWSAWVRFAQDGEVTLERCFSFDNPARAWLIAIIKALIAEETQ